MKEETRLKRENKELKKKIEELKKPRSFCEACFEKQVKIDCLEQEVIRLKALLRYQERKANEGFFGSSTPSSQIPIKPNTTEDKQNKKGGGSIGHVGHGRKKINELESDQKVEIDIGNICPSCGGRLKNKERRERTVIDIEPVKKKKILYSLHRKECSKCGKIFQGKAPGVLPKSLFGNELLSHIAIQHYIYGTTLGRLEEQFGVNSGSIISALHRLSRLFENVSDKLIHKYRQSTVKHADETGWRNDGHSGYSWLFCTNKISIFRFRDSRSSKIVQEVLKNKKLPGVLVVDRYGGYNKAPVNIQYCYSHLLREVTDLEEEFPDNVEINCFVSTFTPLIVQAIRLRSQGISDKDYYCQAVKIKRKILKVVNSFANHSGIQRIQNIFRDNKYRLYHWAKNRDVPADNNLAERELRPTVIARKISFGSQSYEGAKTREILMTVLHTLKKRSPDFAGKFKSALDRIAENPSLKPYQLLFSNDTS